MPPDNQRVVITGLGPVSALGFGIKDFWENLVTGKSAIKPIKSFSLTDGLETPPGGEIVDFNPADYRREISFLELGQSSQYTTIATELALQDAGLALDEIRNKLIGLYVGTTMGEPAPLGNYFDHWIDQTEEELSRREIANIFDSSIPMQVAKELDLNIQGMVLPTACSGGNYAIGHAYHQIQKGSIEMAIAGSTEVFSEGAVTGFKRMLSLAPEKCQPFDKNRKGIVMGEGSGVLILESYEHAKKRKSKIYAEICGYALSCDASHMTIPHLEGVQAAMSNALKNAKMNAKDIDFISAHGTGTNMNDKIEFEAIQNIFQYTATEIPINAIKSMLGHTMSAASSLEAIMICLALKYNVIPPTINYETPDPEIPINCVPNQSQEIEIKTAMNNSFAFGANNACTIFKSI